MAEQKFKVGDRIRITNFTGTIVGTKLEDNSIKYCVKIDQGRIYTWVFQNSLERMVSDTDNFKQKITVETERKTGETVIRISNPKFTTDEPTIKGTIVGDVANKSSEPKITDEQRTVLEGLYLLGYRYLACDCINNALMAYNTRPYKLEVMWCSEMYKIRVNSITKMLDNLCSWKNEKPTSIEWLLGKKAENE